jgi:hypothetical protein
MNHSMSTNIPVNIEVIHLYPGLPPLSGCAAATWLKLWPIISLERGSVLQEQRVALHPDH